MSLYYNISDLLKKCVAFMDNLRHMILYMSHFMINIDTSKKINDAKV